MKPALVIMAAGIGSRYGGLKQIDPIGPNGEIIMDYSIFDALQAGFGKIVFVIKEEMEKAFQERIGLRVGKIADTAYVFQKMEDIPAGFHAPAARAKPWGTGQAVLSCRNVVDTPFAVINADDFYGSSSFRLLAESLKDMEPGKDIPQYCMAGFKLEHTLTENGHVARGVCTVDEEGYLKEIHERTKIRKFGDLTKYTEDDENWVVIPEGSTVSMNVWGFTPDFFNELEQQFQEFLEINQADLSKVEYFLPAAVDRLIAAEKARVRVLPSMEHWYGVTYQEDKQAVKEAITGMIGRGVYPERLWEDRK